MKFWLESLKVKVNQEDMGVEERIILEWMLGRHVCRRELIYFDQTRNRYDVLVNMEINLQVL
jgi:hypothetical protein